MLSEKRQKVATADSLLQLFQDFDYLLFDIYRVDAKSWLDSNICV